MNPTIDITESECRTALVTVLGQIAPTGTKIVNLQQNRVALPTGLWIGFTQQRIAPIATPVHNYPGVTNPDPVSYATSTDKYWDVQLDFCGPGAIDLANMACSLLRDDWGYQAFLATGIDVQIVDVEDPRNTNFINDQDQFEERWSVMMHGEFNPTVTVTQDFANTLNVTLIEVDTTYPTGAP